MKRKFTNLVLAGLFLSGVYAVQAADSLSSTKRAEVQATLAGLPLADAIKTSATLVSVASEADRKVVASAVLRVMGRSYDQSLPQVVGAVSAKVPELAGFVAAEAVWMHPNQAAEITKGAIMANSEQAPAIVECVLFQNPSLYQVVGVAAMDAAPAKSGDILRAISLTTLDLKVNINQALAGKTKVGAVEGKNILLYGIKTSNVSVGYQPVNMYQILVDMGAKQMAKSKYQDETFAGMGQVVRKNALGTYGGVLSLVNNSDFGNTVPASTIMLASSQAASSGSFGSMGASGFMPPPTVTPPPVPLPPTPVNLGVSDTSPEPPGGRTYSAP
jgi:hypothetical protein